MHFFIDFVKSRLPLTWKTNSSGWTTGNCPVCTQNGESRPDTKGRGGFQFNDDEWVYHCFNCGMKTGWSPGSRISHKTKMLLGGLGVDESDIQRVNVELMREAETAELLNPLPKPKEVYKPDWPEISLPEGAISIDMLDESCAVGLQGLTMLHDRKLLHHVDWYYTDEEWKYKNRMILPYRYHGKIVGHTARCINEPKGKMPKYIVTKPDGFVFNLDNQNATRKFVIVTEGDFDALTLDAVALGSNSVNDKQASLINQLNKKTILLPDADKAGLQLIEPAIAEGWSVSFPEWMEEFKDANAAAKQYGRLAVLKSVIHSATDNPSKIRVLARKYLKD